MAPGFRRSAQTKLWDYNSEALAVIFKPGIDEHMVVAEVWNLE